MSRAPRRFAAALAVTAVAAAGCSSPPESPWAVDRDPAVTTTGAPPSGDSGHAGDTGDTTDTDRAAPPPNHVPSATDARILDDECFGDEVRCGRVLVPSGPSSEDRVAIGFTVLADTGAASPLVVLESGFDLFQATAAEIPGRPIVTIGSRARWPGGPRVSCPEWLDLEPDATNAEIAAATETCASRLRATGIELAGTSREQQAADVIEVVRALGITAFDVLASGSRADLVPLLAAEADVGRVAMLEPALAPSDPVVRSAERLELALDHAWTRCRDVTSCDPEGTLDEFLDLVVELDTAPLPYTPIFDGDELEIDTAWMVSALHRESLRPATVGFFPTLHRALIERDAETISRFVTANQSTTANAEWLTQSCGRLTARAADLDTLHAAIRTDAAESARFLAAACPAWADAPETALDHEGGLVVATLSTPDLESLAATADAVIVEPTVGAPSHDCVVAAVAAWFGDGGRVPAEVPACDRPVEIRDPDAAVVLVPGEYVYDDTLSVGLLVPESWNDSGYGTWWRESTPLDDTNIDVYVWFDDQLEDARQDFVNDWTISEPEFSERTIEGRQWLFVAGGDDWDDTGRIRQVVALTQIDDAIVSVVLQTDATEADDLVASVLTPALASVEVT